MISRWATTPISEWPSLEASDGECAFVAKGTPESHPHGVEWANRIEHSQMVEMYEWLASTPGLKGSYTRWRVTKRPVAGNRTFYFSDEDTAFLFKMRWK